MASPAHANVTGCDDRYAHARHAVRYGQLAQAHPGLGTNRPRSIASTTSVATLIGRCTDGIGSGSHTVSTHGCLTLPTIYQPSRKGLPIASMRSRRPAAYSSSRSRPASISSGPQWVRLVLRS